MARFLIPLLWMALFGSGSAAPKPAPVSRQIQNPKSKIKSRTVSFLNDVEPILTRAACNSGACHGSQFGKGGFKLSLAAYDPDLDYQAVVKLSGGRRVSLTEPAKSLLLRKPGMELAHGGGPRLPRGSEDYATVLLWLRQGAPGPNPRDPSVVSLAISPGTKTLTLRETSHVTAVATYSDGSRGDVTAHARINSLDDSVATATPDGLITATGRGATAVMVRYDGLATVSRVVVPYGQPIQNPEFKIQNNLDGLVAAKWDQLGLSPSPVCDDYAFIRRASLDLIGTLPTADEVRRFVADRSPNKRARLVDDLLERPEYADYWTVKWADLLRSSRAALGPKAAASFTEWIRSAFAQNKPYDRFVRELLTAQGPADGVAPANYYRVVSAPPELAETTSQLFLGVRLQCARCHHHPFEKWSQTDYYRFAAFFPRVSQRPLGPAETLVVLRNTGEVTHPKTGVIMEPQPLGLDGAPPFRPEPGDRREALAGWMTSPKNVPFARMLVNRYWAYLLGRGIVEPVDDVRVTNPPSNPELLDALASDFIRSGYDIKQLLRTICRTRAYQLSARPTPGNAADHVFYSHFLPRRQPAEVLLDSVCRATGVPEKFVGLPAGTRAIQLPDPGVASMFLDTFGRPPRSSACECERTMEPSLPQALQLLNGEAVNAKVSSSNGRAAKLAASSLSEPEVVEELYLSALGRPATAGERKAALAAFSPGQQRRATEDLLWALVNMKEFAYIR